jgi:microcystin-dependent protein
MTYFKRTLLGVAAGCGLLAGAPASATCSTEPMLGSICIVGYNFCPRGYTEAAGQILSIAQNTALFSLLGTTFGGNGQTTFALPDLRGRVPRGVGQGPGLSPIIEGEVGGQESVTILSSQMPPHVHGVQLQGTTAAGNSDDPAGAVPARTAKSAPYATGPANVAMAANGGLTTVAGGGQPMTVLDPFLGLRYCIALEGIFPSRN